MPDPNVNLEKTVQKSYEVGNLHEDVYACQFQVINLSFFNSKSMADIWKEKTSGLKVLYSTQCGHIHHKPFSSHSHFCDNYLIKIV